MTPRTLETQRPGRECHPAEPGTPETHGKENRMNVRVDTTAPAARPAEREDHAIARSEVWDAYRTINGRAAS